MNTNTNTSSIYIPPLQIKKSRSNGGPTGQEEVVSPHQIPSPDVTSPAPLSDESVDDLATLRPTFQNYLRATYPFTPSTTLSPSTITLGLNSGDIVLVHSVHTNGWADGTLLENGERGWLPTNYCEAYEQIPMRPLLKALTDFWDLIRAGTDANPHIFQNQDYLRGLIAGVRFLLERSDCLTRDSPLVKAYENLRKTRKALLSDLSLLVKTGKRLQDAAATVQDSLLLEEILDEMLLKAFKIVNRGVRFLDIWTNELQLSSTNQVVLPQTESPYTFSSVQSPRLSQSGAAQSPNLRHDSEARQSVGASDAGRAESHVQRHTVEAARFSSRQSGSASEAGRAESQVQRHTVEDARFSSRQSSRPNSLLSKRMSMTHRMSYSGASTGGRDTHLVSEQLTRSYDAFLGVLASFLGSHLQSRSSSELLLTTQQAVKLCREFLAVIDTVLDQDPRASDVLSEAKDSMYDRITDLVHAARSAFRLSRTSDEDLIYLPEDGRQLLNAATACVRVAGECVAKSRQVLELIGDFQNDPRQSNHSAASWDSNSISSPPKLVSHFTRESNRLRGKSSDGDDAAKGTPEEPEERYPELPESPSSEPSDMPAPQTPPPEVSVDFVTNTNDAPMMPQHEPPEVPRATNRDSVMSFEKPLALPLQRQKSLARTVVISTGSDSTYLSSNKDFEPSVTSATSTRATSPDVNSAANLDDIKSETSDGETTLGVDIDEAEARILEKTYAHELMFNKEGQVIGGTLPALIERLTAHDSTPDSSFISTFFLTFRLFVSPEEFVEALAFRFDYIEQSPRASGPVRLRVYNTLKGWLESHWRHDCDDVALPLVVDFARNRLTPSFPGPGSRLLELTKKVSTATSPLVPRLLSSVGKTNTSIASYVHPEAPLPPSIISRSQLVSLRTWKMGGGGVSVTDFDPLELARQITLKVSGLFCSILPEELLATEWQKRSGSLAVNVSALSTLSTDLANLVADSILQLEEPKKRASTIKQWVKIASKCLELNNFDTLMAIICSLNSTTILRMRKTWDVVSQKTKTLLEELSKVVDISRNSVVLRQRLQSQSPPCLPFVGMYLTDLTFVDHGNQMTRQLTTESGSIPVINFDKHMKTARIISDLQRFQIPYRLAEVPELQIWMQHQLVRVRSTGETSFQNHYRRSLLLEPREQAQQQPSPSESTQKDKDRFDFLAWTHIIKEKPVASHA